MTTVSTTQPGTRAELLREAARIASPYHTVDLSQYGPVALHVWAISHSW